MEPAFRHLPIAPKVTSVKLSASVNRREYSAFPIMSPTVALKVSPVESMGVV